MLKEMSDEAAEAISGGRANPVIKLGWVVFNERYQNQTPPYLTPEYGDRSVNLLGSS
jgi:hypothetical protein